MNSLSVSGKNWLFKKFDSSDVTSLAEKFSLSETVAKLLSIRKNKIDDISLFLEPKIKNLLPNPLQLKDMDKAVERVFQCIKKDETIGIFGDYDVDGASSTAILHRYFNSIKQKTHTYIPDRHKEGYGPSIEGFKKLREKKVKIIFTVDCGTLSFEPINFAQKLKIDVIILDHHQSDLKLPNAHAIINPNRFDDKSGLNYLCAAGVCFVFLVGLNKKLRENNWFYENNINEPNILNLLDLVSLGTVCDVVPLIGLNRAIVKQGLEIIKKRKNLGIKTLYDLCKIETQPSVFDLGYKLGPRINAGGRVGKSSHGAELLSSNNPQKIYQIAKDLDKSNKERQTIESLMIEQIFSEVKKINHQPILIISGNNFHEGVIGIVASRIKEKYNKPSIIISIKDNLGKGSARSVVGFDIGTQIINAVQLGILLKGGGHKMAGGFTLEKDKINIFKDYLIKSFNKKNIDPLESSNLYLDSIIAPTALNEHFFMDINSLAPFGSGNNEPKFMIEDIKVISSTVISNSHIKTIFIGKDGTVFKGFAWNAINSPLEPYLIKGNKKKFNIAGKIRLNEWKGEKKVEFIIEDISLN